MRNKEANSPKKGQSIYDSADDSRSKRKYVIIARQVGIIVMRNKPVLFSRRAAVLIGELL